jgi:hypothetical protein
MCHEKSSNTLFAAAIQGIKGFSAPEVLKRDDPDQNHVEQAPRPLPLPVWSGHSCPLPLTLISLLWLILVRPVDASGKA